MCPVVLQGFTAIIPRSVEQRFENICKKLALKSVVIAIATGLLMSIMEALLVCLGVFPRAEGIATRVEFLFKERLACLLTDST